MWRQPLTSTQVKGYLSKYKTNVVYRFTCPNGWWKLNVSLLPFEEHSLTLPQGFYTDIQGTRFRVQCLGRSVLEQRTTMVECICYTFLQSYNLWCFDLWELWLAGKAWLNRWSRAWCRWVKNNHVWVVSRWLLSRVGLWVHLWIWVF